MGLDLKRPTIYEKSHKIQHIHIKCSLLTKSSSKVIELSVYITNFSAFRGTVSFNLLATNIQHVPNSCKWFFRIDIVERNLSRKFIDKGKTSSSHLCSSQTWKGKRMNENDLPNSCFGGLTRGILTW